MSAHVTIHGVLTVKAHATGSIGAPLILSLVAEDNVPSHSITIFLGDQSLVDRLVGAINGAQGPIYNPPHDHQEAAAYTAQTTLFGDER